MILPFQVLVYSGQILNLLLLCSTTESGFKSFEPIEVESWPALQNHKDVELSKLKVSKSSANTNHSNQNHPTTRRIVLKHKQSLKNERKPSSRKLKKKKNVHSKYLKVVKSKEDIKQFSKNIVQDFVQADQNKRGFLDSLKGANISIENHVHTQTVKSDVSQTASKKGLFDALKGANISIENHVQSETVESITNRRAPSIRRNLSDLLKGANISVENHVHTQTVNFTSKNTRYGKLEKRIIMPRKGEKLTDFEKVKTKKRNKPKVQIKRGNAIAVETARVKEVTGIKRDVTAKKRDETFYDGSKDGVRLGGSNPLDVAAEIESNDKNLIPLLSKTTGEFMKDDISNAMEGNHENHEDEDRRGDQEDEPEYTISDKGNFPAENDPYYSGRSNNERNQREGDARSHSRENSQSHQDDNRNHHETGDTRDYDGEDQGEHPQMHGSPDLGEMGFPTNSYMDSHPDDHREHTSNRYMGKEWPHSHGESPIVYEDHGPSRMNERYNSQDRGENFNRERNSFNREHDNSNRDEREHHLEEEIDDRDRGRGEGHREHESRYSEHDQNRHNDRHNGDDREQQDYHGYPERWDERARPGMSTDEFDNEKYDHDKRGHGYDDHDNHNDYDKGRKGYNDHERREQGYGQRSQYGNHGRREQRGDGERSESREYESRSNHKNNDDRRAYEHGDRDDPVFGTIHGDLCLKKKDGICTPHEGSHHDNHHISNEERMIEYQRNPFDPHDIDINHYHDDDEHHHEAIMSPIPQSVLQIGVDPTNHLHYMSREEDHDMHYDNSLFEHHGHHEGHNDGGHGGTVYHHDPHDDYEGQYSAHTVRISPHHNPHEYERHEYDHPVHDHIHTTSDHGNFHHGDHQEEGEHEHEYSNWSHEGDRGDYANQRSDHHHDSHNGNGQLTYEHEHTYPAATHQAPFIPIFTPPQRELPMFQVGHVHHSADYHEQHTPGERRNVLLKTGERQSVLNTGQVFEMGNRDYASYLDQHKNDYLRQNSNNYNVIGINAKDIGIETEMARKRKLEKDAQVVLNETEILKQLRDNTSDITITDTGSNIKRNNSTNNTSSASKATENPIQHSLLNDTIVNHIDRTIASFNADIKTLLVESEKTSEAGVRRKTIPINQKPQTAKGILK